LLYFLIIEGFIGKAIKREESDENAI